ncbi:hypothetical protein M5D96_004420 [Drosophila gunungcola]|uniref:C-type lectin domain-containing protein n=1 Tax=Drosophila gunungcola TaxID=103775 RepID=A0A9P9YUT1_9MUSC|nr:hypothetical protein M5D96_004420 [Drosophila gunungcola]
MRCLIVLILFGINGLTAFTINQHQTEASLGNVVVGEKIYHFQNNEQLRYSDALLKCGSIDARLLRLQNEEEWIALKQHLDSQKSYFLDMTDFKGKYISPYNSDIVAFLKWESNTPSEMNLLEKCVELQSGNHFMNIVNCSDKKNYICETEFPIAMDQSASEQDWIKEKKKSKIIWFGTPILLGNIKNNVFY